MNTERKYYRQQVDVRLKDQLKAVAASRSITTAELASQVLGRFLEARADLISAIGENNNDVRSE